MVNNKDLNEEARRFLIHFDKSDSITKAINDVKNFDTNSLDELLDKTREYGSIDENKEQIENQISNAEHISKQYYTALLRKKGEKTHLKNLDQKVSCMSDYSNRYPAFLVDSFDRWYNLFKASEESLNKSKNANEKTHLREICSRNYSKTENFFNIIEEKELTSKIDKQKIRHLQEISSLKKQIEELEELYTSILLDKKGFNELKELKKKIKNSWFSKSKIIKGCYEAEYPEGILLLKEFEKEVNYTIKNFNKLKKTKKALDSGIQNLERCIKTNNIEFLRNKEYFDPSCADNQFLKKSMLDYVRIYNKADEIIANYDKEIKRKKATEEKKHAQQRQYELQRLRLDIEEKEKERDYNIKRAKIELEKEKLDQDKLAAEKFIKKALYAKNQEIKKAVLNIPMGSPLKEDRYNIIKNAILNIPIGRPPTGTVYSKITKQKNYTLKPKTEFVLAY